MTTYAFKHKRHATDCKQPGLQIKTVIRSNILYWKEASGRLSLRLVFGLVILKIFTDDLEDGGKIIPY